MGFPVILFGERYGLGQRVAAENVLHAGDHSVTVVLSGVQGKVVRALDELVATDPAISELHRNAGAVFLTDPGASMIAFSSWLMGMVVLVPWIDSTGLRPREVNHERTYKTGTKRSKRETSSKTPLHTNETHQASSTQTRRHHPVLGGQYEQAIKAFHLTDPNLNMTRWGWRSRLGNPGYLPKSDDTGPDTWTTR